MSSTPRYASTRKTSASGIVAVVYAASECRGAYSVRCSGFATLGWVGLSPFGQAKDRKLKSAESLAKGTADPRRHELGRRSYRRSPGGWAWRILRWAFVA